MGTWQRRGMIIVGIIWLMGNMTLPVQAEIRVIGSLTDYAAIAKEIGGEKTLVDHIAYGNQDAHFVAPKPSYVMKMAKADLYITTGLDLELWTPTLIDSSRNPKIREGAPGYVAAYDGMPLLQVPTNPSRAEGDIHIYGNPHIHTSPLNAKIIAENILIGLRKVDPSNSQFYEERARHFKERIDRSLFGEELVELLGADRLTRLAQAGQLINFLRDHDFRGEPLIQKLGGWLGKALPFRGERIIAYHKNWIYFTTLFGLDLVDYVELKPGIPPSPKHLNQLITRMQQEKIRVLLAVNYFEQKKPQFIAERTGAQAVIVPLSVSGIPEVQTYFDLLDYWIDHLLEAFTS